MQKQPKPSSTIFRFLMALFAVLVLGACDESKDKGEAEGATLTIPFEDGTLELQVCTSDIIRVLFTEDDEAFFARETLATAPKRCDDDVTTVITRGDEETTLATDTLTVKVDMASGAVSFFDADGGLLLAEQGRDLEPVKIQDEAVYHIHQEWEPREGEAFYGLGQHQQNLMNIKEYPLSLMQYNTQIVVPFVVSSEGYGLLWDNTSYTRWGDLTEFESIHEGGSTSGEFEAEVTGDYIFQTYSSGSITLAVDGEVVIDHYRQGWLPGRDYAKVHMEAGETYSLELTFASDIGVNIADLSFLPPREEPVTSLWSNVGDGIDYYFVHGPEMDDVIGGYRRLTGEAPMMPRWAFGLWQCRERYTSAEEVLEVLDGFRSRDIPVDNIVQDWQYWVPGTWGSHRFDESRYPDPAGWIEQIHDDYDARLMISVWPKFHANSANFDELLDAGFLYELNLEEDVQDFMGNTMTYFDAFNADARKMFWSQINDDLFSLGVDAWWMDATEPEVVEGPYESLAAQRELYETHMHPTAMGSGSRMLNGYSIVNSQAIYEGQRKEAPNQRVFILTRSAFAGQQRYASASWSGDITTTWTAFKKQIPAGLGFTVSGIPYWTMDIGGFSEKDGAGDGVEWGELNTRWFQYGTFTPLLRVHGQDDKTGPREMWNFNEESYTAILKFDRLRYRLLPYIYSLAGAVTHRAYTIMRPLVMDFRTDESVREVGDQYMFGPAFLVSPVTDFEAREREVVLPDTPGGWYSFWTGEAEAGGRTVTAAAPYDEMPLFMRAGSIVPTGPELQFAGETAWDPITLYVYAGADGAFTLYEDQGLTYDYEDGEYAEIPITWDDETSTLTLGARQGSFDGMVAEHTFNVILVSKDTPVGFSFEPEPQESVMYEGEEVVIGL